MILKVVSGGQTGADQAGLRAAKACEIPTGGWLPQGCITLDGPRFDRLEIYSMQEHPKTGYPPRTEANVRDSDGTLRFASNFKSSGEKCTLKAIRWFHKPYLDLDVTQKYDQNAEWIAFRVRGSTVAEVVQWIKTNKIQVLNIAGNSEETSPGIEQVVYDFLVEVFKALKEIHD